jgi:hypothetical protein
MPSLFTKLRRKIFRRSRPRNRPGPQPYSEQVDYPDDPSPNTESPASSDSQFHQQFPTRPESRDLLPRRSPQPPSEKYGLFQLSDSIEDNQAEDLQLPDIIAVHGINGSAFETWTHENGTMWLKDLLPKQLPGWRVYTFGYPAEIAFTRADGSIDEFASTLLAEVNLIRDSKVNMALSSPAPRAGN